MKTSIVIIASVLAVLAAVFLVVQEKEGFDAVGLIFNRPPEWFNKASYNPNDWIVSYNPDQLAKPGGCDMHYRGNPRRIKLSKFRI